MDEKLKRSDVDDFAKRNSSKDSYKNRKFKNKRTTADEYTGQTIFYSSSGVNSLNKSSRHYTTKKTSNIDHVIPVDTLIDRYGDKLSKEEIKKIANADYNLAVTSEYLNKSKSNMSNHQYLYKQFKDGNPESLTTTYNMIQKQLSSTIATNSVASIKQLKTLKVDDKLIGGALYQGSSSAIIALTVSGINNLTLVASGDKDIDDALKDISIGSSTAFVTETGLKLAQDEVCKISSQLKDSKLKKILTKDLPIAELSLLSMVGSSVIRYIDDDISAEECSLEILMNGAGMLAYNLGTIAGGPAGAVIASIVVAQISKTITQYKNSKRINKAKEIQINRLVGEALIEMEIQRKNLHKMIDDKFKDWDRRFDLGFEQIFNSAIENDVEGISCGLNSILSVFNSNAKFSTLEEFNDFFDDKDSILTL